MAQTELMLRLLRKGKIVGYHKQEQDKFLGYVLLLFSLDSKIWDKEWNDIEYDSFELGVKVKASNDEWWFEGDIIRYGKGKYELVYRKDYGILALKLLDWYGTATDTVHELIYFYDIMIPKLTLVDETINCGTIPVERIGNIHEHPMNARASK